MTQMSESSRSMTPVSRSSGRNAIQGVSHVTNQTQFFQPTNHHITYVGLPPVQPQSGLRGPRVVIAMPILALKKLHETEPAHVATGILADGRVGFAMTDAVYEARGVKREDQNGSRPARRRQTSQNTTRRKTTASG